MATIKNLLQGEQLLLPLDLLPAMIPKALAIGARVVFYAPLEVPGNLMQYDRSVGTVLEAHAYYNAERNAFEVGYWVQLGTGVRVFGCLNPCPSDSKIVPLERQSEVEQAEAIHDAIAALEIVRERLKGEGAIAPEHCWIETGRVKGRRFRQAWWRSEKPIFRSKRDPEKKVRTCYIGEEGGSAHQEAKLEKQRRDRLKQIDQYLQKLADSV
jgi:hypothetical protein